MSSINSTIKPEIDIKAVKMPRPATHVSFLVPDLPWLTKNGKEEPDDKNQRRDYTVDN